MLSFLIVALFVALSLTTSVHVRHHRHSLHHLFIPHVDDCSNSPTPTPTRTDDCPDPLPTAKSSPPIPTSMIAPPPAPPVSAVKPNGPFTGGVATYFYQNGNAGACGWYNSDNAMICAMDQARFGISGPASPLCGRRVQITNLNNNQTVTVIVADDCPTCLNGNSIDLSVAAFQALSDLSVGEIPISWFYTS